MEETKLITKAVGEILDGRYFVIPSYQRKPSVNPVFPD